MPNYQVTITRTTVEISIVEVLAKDEESAENKVQAKCEPQSGGLAEHTKSKKYFEELDGGDEEVTFEYEVEELC